LFEQRCVRNIPGSVELSSYHGYLLVWLGLNQENRAVYLRPSSRKSAPKLYLHRYLLTSPLDDPETEGRNLVDELSNLLTGETETDSIKDIFSHMFGRL